MEVAQRKLEVAADNLANAETDGFHRHLLAASGAGRLREGVATGHLPLHPTGRQLDLAVAGDGSLRVAPRGPSGYDPNRAIDIRSAAFVRAPDGTLHDQAGRALLGAHGAVRIPQDVAPGDLEIRGDGSFVARGTVLGRVSLPASGSLRSGFLAGSDVNPISEMVVILDAQRQFETAEKALGAIDGARQKSVDDVGKIQ
jgi:flagellar basal-body rod protein FlgG